MSIGLRDQRVRVYGYSDSGDEGRAGETYPYLDEFWGRVTSPSGREATIAAQAEETLDALVFLSDEIIDELPDGKFPVDGLLSIGPTFYKVLSIFPARMTREIGVRVSFAESASYAITGAP